MSSHLDPLILKKLQAFARRRRNLILMRGLFAALAMLAGTMILVAGADMAFPLMADWVRWALSSVAYAAVLVIAWRQCLRQLLHAPDERQIARLVEHAEPKLREDLLSAVELGRTQGEVFDSEQFRSLLQSDVSARMQGLEMKSLLPVGLIKRYIGVTAVIAGCVVALIMVSQNRFTTLLLRALMPGANLENVAATQLRIIEPQDGDATVPHGEVVKVVVQVKGVKAKKAKMESNSTTVGRRITEMTPDPDHADRFIVTVQVGRENVRYRMQAGDGRTRFFELTAVARPHEVAFEKTFHYPEYAKMPAKTVQDDHGNLAALEGTEVELKISTNQPVKSGSLRMDLGKKQIEIPLQTLPDGKVMARVPMTGSGSYRVNLVAAKTDFVNKFSPEYEVRSAADLLPTVELLEPKQDLISGSDELIKLSVHASDDVGLAKVVQMVKLNEGKTWKEYEFKQELGREAVVKREWDLAAEGVKAGDLLTTKIVATDLKGSKTETRPLQITVVAAGFDMKRLSGLKSRQTLYAEVKALAGSAAVLGDVAKAAVAKFGTGAGAPEKPAEVPALVTALTNAYVNYDGKLTAAWLAINDPLRDAPPNHEAADLMLITRLLSLTHSGEAQPMRKYLDLLNATPARPDARDLMRLAGEHADRVKLLTQLALDAYKLDLSAEEIDVVAELCIVINAEQTRIRTLSAAAKVPEDWAKITTRMRTVLSVSKNVDSVLDSLKTHGGPTSDRAAQMQISFGRECDKLNRLLDAESASHKLKGKFEAFANLTMDKVNEVFEIKQTLAGQLITTKVKKTPRNPRDAKLADQVATTQADLTEEVDPVWVPLAGLLAEQATIEKLEKLTADERTALVDSRWELKADIFKARGDFEEIRAGVDSGFVADLRRATVALQAVRARNEAAEKTAARVELMARACGCSKARTVCRNSSRAPRR